MQISGLQLGDVGEPLLGARHVGPGGVGRKRRVAAAEHEIAAHAGGEVEHDVDVRRAHALDHLAVERDVAAALAGLGIAHVDVRDGRPGARRLESRRRRSPRA